MNDANGNKVLYDITLKRKKQTVAINKLAQTASANGLAHLPQTVIDRIGNSGTSAAGKTVVGNNIPQSKEKVKTSDKKLQKKFL